MFVANAAQVIFFLMALLAEILVGLLVCSYAAYSFLEVVSQTAAGNDEVIWPGDVILEWMWNIWYLLWIVAIWAVPPALVLTYFNAPSGIFAGILFAVLCLLVPIGLLSSLSAPSRWVVLRPYVVRLLARHPLTLLGFYISSGLLLAACAFLWYLGLVSPVYFWLVPASIAGAAGFLIYARLLGRIGLVISREGREAEDEEEPEGTDKIRTASSGPAAKPHGDYEATPKKKRRGKRRIETYDPWAPPAEEPRVPAAPPKESIPPEDEDPYGPARGAYELSKDETPRPPSPPVHVHPFMAENVSGYDVSSPAERRSEPESEPPDSKVERTEGTPAAPRELPPLPAPLLVIGVYSFPFYPTSLGAFAKLALGFLMIAALFRVLVLLAPTSGGP